MKKFSFFFCFCLAFLGFSANVWGYELTVANSTAGSSAFFPVYGNYCDYYQHVQIIYSSSDLSAMSGSNITGLTFYIKDPAAAAWTASFQISLAEIVDADFGDSTYPAPGFKSASLTTVYEGTLDATGSTLSIEFNTPFLYGGGNLLFDLKVTTTGNYKDATFYAQAAVYTGSIYGVEGHNSSSLGSITTSNNQSRVYPKTTFTYESATPATCPKPTDFAYDNLTSSSVNLSWTAGGTEEEWNIQYKAAGDADWTTIEGVTENPYTLSGLEPETNYQVKVQAICGVDDVSNFSNTLSISTPCGARSLPFEEDFSSALSSCWKRVDCHSYSTVESGKFRFYYNTNPPQYLITPELASAGKKVSVEFKYSVASSSYPETFAVGYSTTTNDVSAFTFGSVTTATNTSLATYSTTLPFGVKYVAIKYTSNNQYSLYIDDLTITVVMDCAQPEDVTASSVTNSTAHIAWTARAGIATYQYCVVARDAAPDWSDNLTTATNSVDLAGLSASTDYDFYVRCVCSVDEYSDVSDVCQFATTAGCPTPNDVTFSNQTHNSATVTWTAGGGEGAWNLRYQAGSGEWTTPVRLTATTYNLTGLTPGTTYTVEVQADCDGTWASNTYTPTCPSIGTITQSAPTACGVTLRWTAGGSETGWNVRYKADGGDYAEPVHVTSPTYTLSGLTTGTTYYYQVQADCGGDWTAEGSYTPACPIPGTPSFSNQTYNSVRVSWTAGNCEETWNLRYKKGSDDWTVVSDLTSRTYDATGLVAGNEYMFQVQAGCEGSWSAASTYTPSCAQPGAITLSNKTYNSVTVAWAASGTLDSWNLQYKEADAADIPANWTNVVMNTASRSGHTISGLTTDVAYTIRLTAACCTAEPRDISYTPVCATPASASVTSIRDVQASASWSASSGSGITTFQYVVVPRDATPDWSAATEKTGTGATLTGLTVATNYDFYVRSKCADGNFSESLKRQFTTVAQQPGGTITNTDLTYHSATFTWTQGGAETQYQWACKTSGTPSADDWSEPLAAGVREVTVTGLTARTNYTFYVRSYYSAGVTSSYRSKAFTTECGPITVDAEHPWTYGFEDISAGYGVYNIPDCWSKIANGNYPYVDYTSYRSGNRCMRLHGGESSSPQYIVLPVFENVNNLTLSFYYKAEEDAAGYYNDYVYAKPEIGYMTDASNTATFVRLGDALPQSESSYVLAEQVISGVPDGARIAIRYTGDGTVTDAGNMYIDDIEMSVSATCLRPTSPICIATTSNSATLSWTENGETTNWEIEYSVNADFSSSTMIAIVDENPFSITGLKSNTLYYARVRGVCSEEEKSPWCLRTASFRTDCGILLSENLPYTYGFESDTETGSGKIPYCWSSISYSYEDYWDETIIYPYVYNYSSSAYAGNNSLYFYDGRTGSGEQYVILPEFEDDIRDLTFEMYYKQNSITETYYAQLTVGYFATPGNVASFTAVKALTRTSSYTKATINFDDVPEGIHNIAIRWGGGSAYATYAYIDDIKINSKANIFTNNKGTGDGSWSSASNWNHGTVPTINDDVVIRKPVTVSATTIAKAKNVVIDTKGSNTGSITVAPKGELIIANTLRQKTDEGTGPTSENNLAICTAAEGNGVLAVGTHDGTNRASVGFYTLACKNANGWVNQYFGTPFCSLNDIYDDYYGSYIYKFDASIPEPTGDEGETRWVNIKRGTPTEAFAGYNILRKDATPTTLWMQGTLCPSTTQTLNLYYNGSSNTENMLANSWMAPISIAAMGVAAFNNCEATIYIFNAGSTEQYDAAGDAAQSAVSPGQYITLPVGSATWTSPTIKVIPSMQAFSVYATAANPQVTLNYNTAVLTPLKNNSLTNSEFTAATRAPKRRNGNDNAGYEDKPDIMRLRVTGENGLADNVYLLMREDFTPAFDNGYDGRKMYGDDAAPQLYAVSLAGEMTIDCVADAEGTTLGFVPGADNAYTLSFSYDGDNTLYLNDLKERTSARIAEGNTYAFFSSADDNPQRFIISATPIANITTDISNNTSPSEQGAEKASKVLLNNLLLILRNGRVYTPTGTSIR